MNYRVAIGRKTRNTLTVTVEAGDSTEAAFNALVKMGMVQQGETPNFVPLSTRTSEGEPTGWIFEVLGLKDYVVAQVWRRA